jgi:hypothetical protein
MKTKVELLEEIVKKQDELITATKIFIAFKGHNFIEVVGSERLGKELASLKSQLEAGEEKKIDQNCANCKYNNLKSYLEPCNTCKMSFTNWQPR